MNGTEAEKPEPKFSVALSATAPLQLTITKISLQLIKNLVEVYCFEFLKIKILQIVVFELLLE